MVPYIQFGVQGLHSGFTRGRQEADCVWPPQVSTGLYLRMPAHQGQVDSHMLTRILFLHVLDDVCFPFSIIYKTQQVVISCVCRIMNMFALMGVRQ